MWRAVVVMSVFGLVYGIVLSGVISYFTVIGFDIDKARSRFLAPALILPCVHWVLHTKWSDFRIALIREHASDAPANGREANVAGV